MFGWFFFLFKMQEKLNVCGKQLSPIKSFIFLRAAFSLFLVGMVIFAFFLKEDVSFHT